ncbi:MAG: AMP-binding protein [Clostridia bacterium]|nr:AMP-binding protein [Clostridia bacterium]MBQ7940764.1 AMP-binding protein [Clostridia bacterium]
MAELVYNVRDILTFRDLIGGSAELYGDLCAFTFREGDGIREVTYREAYDDVRAFAAYLNSLGLSGKKVGVMGKNGYPWALTYLAVTCGVGVIVPIDRELKPDELQHVVDHSELSAIVHLPDAAEKVEALAGDFLRLNTASLAEYIAAGETLRAMGDTSYENHHVDPHGLGILLYTSGTTGLAKGVMLSQYNICSNIMNVLRMVSVGVEDRVLSILPLHHTYECMAGFLAPLYAGASIAYNDSLRRLTEDFKLFSPTVLIAVPLVLETLRNNIIKRYGKIKGGNALLAVQRRVSDAARALNPDAGRKIFSTVANAFGGRLTRILSGAALLPEHVHRDMERFGFKVYIGYGLTETSPVCLMHNDFYRAPDDIGFPIVGGQAKLVDPDENGLGELAYRGANVMLGYYKNPEETAKVLRDGWFHTGDLARVKENGAYQITGRKKSMIVTQNGKKIFPEELEFYLDQSEYVAECMVYGEEGEHDVIVTAAVFPNYPVIEERLAGEGIHPGDDHFDSRVREIITKAVKEVNEKLPSFRRIMKICIRKTEFVKTTTRKIKRTDENRGE